MRLGNLTKLHFCTSSTLSFLANLQPGPAPCTLSFLSQTDYGASLRSAAGAPGHALRRTKRTLGRAQAWAETTPGWAEASSSFHSRVICISLESEATRSLQLTPASSQPAPCVPSLQGAPRRTLGRAKARRKRPLRAHLGAPWCAQGRSLAALAPATNK